MKLRNKKTGEVIDVTRIIFEHDNTYSPFSSLRIVNEYWEDYTPSEPFIKDEKIRKAVRAWAEVLGVNEVEFYGSDTWIGFSTKLIGSKWSSKFELDYSGSKNTFVTFKTYTIDELCGEDDND